jgi:hypothetical protein
VTAYHDLDSPQAMREDASAATHNLPAPHAAPAYLVVDYDRDMPKRDIRISEAAQRLANAMQLHLD